MIAHLGGVFIYAKDAKILSNWYATFFDLKFSQYGKTTYGLEFPYKEAISGKNSSIVFSIMENVNRPELTERVFCVNLRVLNMEELVESIRTLGWEIADIQIFPEGKFTWLKDLEGNHLELWEDTMNK
ncbi:MAG: VOC family protein [Bacteroidia bacterium]